MNARPEPALRRPRLRSSDAGGSYWRRGGGSRPHRARRVWGFRGGCASRWVGGGGPRGRNNNLVMGGGGARLHKPVIAALPAQWKMMYVDFVFVQILIHICSNFDMYLSKLQNVFFITTHCLLPRCKMICGKAKKRSRKFGPSFVGIGFI